MSPLTIASVIFACVFGSALLAMLLGRALPEHHLRPESKEAVKLGLALVATLAALVLGLLISAAKGAYDTQNNAVRQFAADVLLLDRILSLYGSETKEAQDLLRRGGAATLDRLWPEDSSRSANLTPGEARELAESFYGKVAELAPRNEARRNEAQRSLRARALEIATRLFETRMRMYVQKDNAIPLPFLVVLVFWLIILFGGYALLAPRNVTVIAALFVCALSVSGALFLILELDRPYEGIMRLSSAPLREALAQIGK
jgi:hypothetical protein